MLEGPSGVVEETIGILKIAVDYYKMLFGFEQKIGVDLANDFWDDDDKVSNAQNEVLDAPFSEKEVKDAVFSSYERGPLDLMVSPFYFTKLFGILLKRIF